MIKFVIIVYSIIISLITSIFNISNVKIEKLEYDLYVGSQMQIEYSVFGEEVDLTFKSNDEYIVIVDDDGLMHGIKFGITTIDVSYNDENVEIIVKVIELDDIKKPNQILNTINCIALEYEMNNYFSSKIFKNGYNIDMSFKARSSLSSSNEFINMKLLDDYIEITDKESKLVYEIKDKNIYEHTIYEEVKRYKTIEMSKDSFDIYDVNEFKDISLNMSKINLNKIGNEYYIQAKYEDLIDYEFVNELCSKYNNFGISLNMLYDKIIFIRFKITNDAINIDISFNYDIESIFYNLPTFLNININLSKEKIKKIDLDKYEYVEYGNVLASKDVNVNEEFNINNEIVKVKLEKGYYLIKSTNPNYKDSFEIELSDINNKYIDKLFILNFEEHNIFDNLYYIDYDDYYYFSINANEGIDIPIIIEKLDYKDNVSYHQINHLGTSKGEIEGYGDIDHYVIVSDSAINKSDIYMVKNIGDNDITIYTNNLSPNKNFEKITIKPNDSIYFEMIGRRDLFITADDYLYGSGYKYNLKMEKIENHNKYDVVDLTQELSEDYYISAKNYGQRFKFTINERSVFKLKYKCFSSYMNFDYYIPNIEKYKDNYVLDPGTYYLILEEKDNEVSIGYIGYELCQVTDELLTANRPENFNSDIECTNIGENISLEFNKCYVKYYLTPGQYYFDSDTSIGKYHLYDEILNEIIYDNNSISSDIDKNTFIIDKEGYYFIYFDTLIESKPLMKANYETLYSDIKEISLSNTGYIEGKYDMDVYKYTIEVNKIYKIINTSAEDLVLYYIPYASKIDYNPVSTQIVLKQNEFVFLVGTGRTFNLYITTFDISENKKYNYSFDFIEFDRNIDSENIDEITFEYSEKKYLMGYNLEEIKLKFNISELGVYKIESNVEKHSVDFNYFISSNYDESISSYGYSKNYILDKGEYIITLYSMNSISYGQLKVTKVEDYNLINFELDIVSQYDNYEKQFTIPLDNYDTSENSLFFFNIEEKSDVVYKYGYKIYDVKTNQIVEEKGERHHMRISTLEKGIYYFTINKYKEVEYLNYFEIGKIKEEAKQLSILTIGSSYANESNKYLYDILSDIGYESIKVANLYIDNITFEDNYNNILNSSYNYRYIENVNGISTINENYNALEAICERNWDHVIIQGSMNAAEKSQYYMIYSFIDLIHNYIYNSKLYWYSGWAWNDSSTLKEFEQYGSYDAMLKEITEYMYMADTVHIERLIPVSTAIQNAKLGGINDDLLTKNHETYNNLTDDMGCYLSSMMIVKSILNTNIDLSTINFYPNTIDIKYKRTLIYSVNMAYEYPFYFSKSNFLKK